MFLSVYQKHVLCFLIIVSLVFAIVDYRTSFEIHGKTLASSFFNSSGKCEYHCCAGPRRAFCIVAIRFRFHVYWYGESVCSGPAVIAIFAVKALRESSVV